MTSPGKPPIWFGIMVIIALLWNALGAAAYFSIVTMSAADFAALPPMHRNLLQSQPFWHSAMLPLAVFSGFLGAILLLIRKRMATRMFLLSLFAVLVQTAGYFILDGYLEFVQANDWLLALLIPVMAVIFLLFARRMETEGYLR